MKKPLVVIAGATASGKTGISIDLAKKINGEVVSADSMQIYKYMDIGTATPTLDETDGVKHYLISELNPDDDYSIVKFQEMAKKYIDEIHNQGKIPILCGGTGFYINSVVYNNNFMETDKDENLRNELYKIAEEQGNEFLHQKLKAIDYDSYLKIHPNNLKRVVRAIEFFETTGVKISVHNEEEKNKKEEAYDAAFFIIDRNRDNLYERINRRVDIMINDGLVDEVKRLIDNGYNKNLVSMQGLGYKEIVEYLENEITLDEAVEKLKKQTRRFAKRQLTWFRHQSNGERLNLDVDNNPIETILNRLNEKGIFTC